MRRRFTKRKGKVLGNDDEADSLIARIIVWSFHKVNGTLPSVVTFPSDTVGI